MNEPKNETDRLLDVHDFWNADTWTTRFSQKGQDQSEFFDRFRKYKYETEWHIPNLVPFADARGKRVLEIGCGHGVDGVNLALNGGQYTGVDLTEEAVASTAEHFRRCGLAGEFRLENAEHLSFPDGSFDIVYSHGVLHHTPDPVRAVDEVY